MHLDNPDVIRDLLIYNRPFIAPVVSKHNSMRSNFWGALASNGFYARSDDYIDIVTRKVFGMWNVPYVGGGYLIHKNLFNKLDFFYNTNVDPDMSLSEKMRDSGVFMYVTNEKEYGHLVDDSEFDPTRTHPDLYMLPISSPTTPLKYHNTRMT